jgi:hypothetical protein
MSLLITDVELILKEMNFIKNDNTPTNGEVSYHLYHKENLTVILEEAHQEPLDGKVNIITFSGVVVPEDMKSLNRKFLDTGLGGTMPFHRDFEFKMKVQFHPMYGLNRFKEILGLITELNIVRPHEYYSEIAGKSIPCNS